MPQQLALMRGVPFVLQTAAAATGNGIVVAIPPGFKNHTFHVTGSAGIASGVVTLEHASDPLYAGTWAQVAAPVTPLASTDLVTLATGVYNFVRARISTIVVGGTVTVTVTSD